MGIILDAVSIFMYGIYADFYRRTFEYDLKKRFLSGMSISCPHLTAKSNKIYRIHSRLKNMEREFQRKIYIKYQKVTDYSI